jgi:ABC-type glycerol-3-phosphate transport system permease component
MQQGQDVRFWHGRRRKRMGKIAKACLLTVIALLINLPILTMILGSLQTNDDLLVSTTIIPTHITFINYTNLASQTDFFGFFKNSLIVGGISTLATVLIAAFGGYALSRYRTPIMDAYAAGILLLQMFPIILVLIPVFLIFKTLGLINTYWSAILIYISGNLPFAMWLYRGFFGSVPRELEEAAWMDGCSRLQGFFRIVLRVSAPGVVAVAILSFLAAWNDFLIANIFLNQESLMTIPVGIQMFIQQYTSQWASLMAAATLAMLPVVVFFAFVQKYMVQGMTAGAVKG